MTRRSRAARRREVLSWFRRWIRGSRRHLAGGRRDEAADGYSMAVEEAMTLARLVREAATTEEATARYDAYRGVRTA